MTQPDEQLQFEVGATIAVMLAQVQLAQSGMERHVARHPCMEELPFCCQYAKPQWGIDTSMLLAEAPEEALQGLSCLKASGWSQPVSWTCVACP